jgi:hypothetical protein
MCPTCLADHPKAQLLNAWGPELGHPHTEHVPAIVTWPDTCVSHVLQIIPWLNYSVPGVLNLSILTVNTCLAFYSFLGCVVADPGSVPFDYVPDAEVTAPVVEVKRKVRGYAPHVGTSV